MLDEGIEIKRTWMSQIVGVSVFIIACVGAAVGSVFYPSSVLSGPIVNLGGSLFYMDLPMLMLIPLVKLSYLLWRMYDARFLIDSRGVEMVVGVLSLNQKRVKVRFEDIRAIELEQTILGRVLNFGDVLVGSAATGEIEITIDSIAAPFEVQEMIQVERDRRLRLKSKLSEPSTAAVAE